MGRDIDVTAEKHNIFTRHIKSFALTGSMLLSSVATAADVYISTPPLNPGPGQSFEVEVSVDVGPDVLGSYFINFVYDPSVVTIMSIAGGDTPAFSPAPTTDSNTFTSGVTPVAYAQENLLAPTGLVHIATITLTGTTLVGATSLLDGQMIELSGAMGQSLGAQVFPSSVQLAFNAADDTDSDGLTDLNEANSGTDINNEDTDGDSLLDGFEVNGNLDPLDNGLVNINQGASGDPDGDGLTNLQEQAAGSHPNRPDTDFDGLNDAIEVSLGTNPASTDSDGDGLSDLFEVNGSLDPLDNGSVNPDNGAAADPDLDDLTNTQEAAAGTLPQNSDTDADGLPDGFEVNNALDPLDNGSLDFHQGDLGDPDLDGHTNLEEFQIGSLPQDRYSQPVNLQLQMRTGMQPLFYPLDLPVDFSAHDLLALLNSGSDVVSSVETFINGNTVQSAQWNAGVPGGSDFVLTPGQGVMAQVTADNSQTFTAAVVCPPVDLVAGANTIGFRCVQSGQTAMFLLLAIGSEVVVSSIQRFNTTSGRYETVMYDNGAPAGTDFPVVVGETYLIHMLVNLPGFDPLLQ